MLWYGGFRSTPRYAFSSDTGQRAGGQSAVLARCIAEAARSHDTDVLDGNICHRAPSQIFPSLSLNPTHLFTFPFYPPSFLSTSPVQLSEVTTAVKQQAPVAVVVRGPGAAPPTPVQARSTTRPTINSSPITRATPSARQPQL